MITSLIAIGNSRGVRIPKPLLHESGLRDQVELVSCHITFIGQVKPADVIGAEGDTGWATGPHLHFQVDVFGIPVNPRTFLQDNP